MIALSLWRPWCWAFFHAGKRVENRTWAPPKKILGKWILMHAAKRFDDEAHVAMLTGRLGEAALLVPLPSEHPTGIVGAMRVSGSCLIGDVRIASPWYFGPWCWFVTEIIELPAPIPCKGAQGLWSVPPEVEAQIHAVSDLAGKEWA